VISQGLQVFGVCWIILGTLLALVLLRSEAGGTDLNFPVYLKWTNTHLQVFGVCWIILGTLFAAMFSAAITSSLVSADVRQTTIPSILSESLFSAFFSLLLPSEGATV
jgi:hypothetical protein